MDGTQVWAYVTEVGDDDENAVSILECLTCGALIPPSNIAMHIAWDNAVRRD